MAESTGREQMRTLIDAYGDMGFRLRGQRHEGSILLHEGGIEPWRVTSVEELSPEALDSLLQRISGAEILIIGIGPRQKPLPPALMGRLVTAGIGLETMDTGAACRTYNVLVAEGRRVAAALIAVP